MMQLAQQGKVDHKKAKMMMEKRQEMFSADYAASSLFSRWWSFDF